MGCLSLVRVAVEKVPRLASIAVVSYLAACVPFAMPPSRFEVGGGTYVGGPAPVEPEPGAERGALMLRGAVHPLGATHDPATQLLDVGAGYHAEWQGPVAEQPVHGPYAEFGVFPVRARVGSGSVLRWGGYTTFDLLFQGEGRGGLGFGGSFGTLVELVRSTTGAFGEADDDGLVVAGSALGQWGVGLFGGGALRDIQGARYGSFMAGVSLRVPLAVGIACCVWPDSDSDSDDEGHAVERDDEPQPRRLERPNRPEKPAGRKRREYVPARPRRVERLQSLPSQAMPGASTPGQPST